MLGIPASLTVPPKVINTILNVKGAMYHQTIDSSSCFCCETFCLSLSRKAFILLSLGAVTFLALISL